MHLYVAIPATAAMVLAATGFTCLFMGPETRANRIAAWLLLPAAWWALCEVLWSGAPDAETALLLHRLAAPGFVFIAPLVMALVVDVSEARPQRVARALPAAWGLAGGCLVLAWSGPWLLARMQPADWGWALVPGPGFAVWTALSVAGIGWALNAWIRDYRTAASSVVRRQAPLVAQAMVPAAALGFGSDAVLPLLGVQVPRVGSLAVALVGVSIVWAFSRYGYSRLHPQAFSHRILHTLPDGIALTTLHGRIRVANERLGELLGVPLPELVGRPLGDHLDPGLLDPLRERREVECELRPAAGPPIPVSVSTAPVEADETAPGGVVLAIQDLREVAALRQRLLTSGRLAAVGQLAAGIAHEINNPLAYVRSNLSLLREEWARVVEAMRKAGVEMPEGADDWEELLDDSLEGVDRAATIVRDVREFSHAGGVPPALADLNEVLEQVLRVARPQMGADTRVEARLDEVGTVSGDAQRLKQLFLNLVVNAAQALEGPGRVQVESRGDAEHVEVVVRDDGRGIPPEVRERIFDPFFTTKAVGAGTGLGLSIAHEIVRSHGGQIWCESEPGRGSAFHVRLPRGGPPAG